jgi:hypothetical protein
LTAYSLLTYEKWMFLMVNAFDSQFNKTLRRLTYFTRKFVSNSRSTLYMINKYMYIYKHI